MNSKRAFDISHSAEDQVQVSKEISISAQELVKIARDLANIVEED